MPDRQYWVMIPAWLEYLVVLVPPAALMALNAIGLPLGRATLRCLLTLGLVALRNYLLPTRCLVALTCLLAPRCLVALGGLLLLRCLVALTCLALTWVRMHVKHEIESTGPWTRLRNFSSDLKMKI